MEEWPPDKIKKLRRRLGMTQAEMGQEIWDASEATAQKNLSNLERGEHEPTAAVRRHLQRLRQQAS